MILDPSWLFDLNVTHWPQVELYDKQCEVVEATLTCKETYVTAGNQLGKDFLAGFLALGCFALCRQRGITCRILTTSVAEHHLKVLWGEIGRFWSTSRVPLAAKDGGDYEINYQEIRRKEEQASKNPINYLVGRVSAKGEGLAGHHAEFSLLIGDEASGLDDEVYKMAQGWAKHMLFIGNPNPTDNFFKRAVKAGDLLAA